MDNVNAESIYDLYVVNEDELYNAWVAPDCTTFSCGYDHGGAAEKICRTYGYAVNESAGIVLMKNGWIKISSGECFAFNNNFSEEQKKFLQSKGLLQSPEQNEEQSSADEDFRLSAESILNMPRERAERIITALITDWKYRLCKSEELRILMEKK